MIHKSSAILFIPIQISEIFLKGRKKLLDTSQNSPFAMPFRQTLLARETGKVRHLPGDMRVLLDPAHKKIHHPQRFVFLSRLLATLEMMGGPKNNGRYEEITLGSLHVFSAFFWLLVTLPETNIAPETRPSQKEINLPIIHFQGLC